MLFSEFKLLEIKLLKKAEAAWAISEQLDEI